MGALPLSLPRLRDSRGLLSLTRRHFGKGREEAGETGDQLMRAT